MSIKSASPRAAELVATGWAYDGGKLDDVGYCTAAHGCIRACRWSHRFVGGAFCTQHALMALDARRGEMPR
jgi:hypothetical protein